MPVINVNEEFICADAKGAVNRAEQSANIDRTLKLAVSQ